ITFTYNSNKKKKQLQLQNRPLFQLLDKHERKTEIEEQKKLWFFELEKVYNQVIAQSSTNSHNNNHQFTSNFNIYMKSFWNKIVKETNYINKFKRKNDEESHHSNVKKIKLDNNK